MPKRRKKQARKKAEKKSSYWTSVLVYAAQALPLLGVLVAVAVILLRKDSFSRFNAIQALLFAVVGWIVYGVVTFMGDVELGLFVAVLLLLGWLYCIYKSFLEERPMLPVLGNIAAEHA